MKATPPGVILINPKHEHNVGAALRACSCWGVRQLLWTGKRVDFGKEGRQRIPREERMKGYRDVNWDGCPVQRPLDLFGDTPITPVAVEVRENSECLTQFEHPENAVYLFGPEDGSIPTPYLHLCHRFVYIPTHHCLNLSAAVNVVLAHRRFQRQLAGIEPILPLNEVLHERRGIETPALDKAGWDGK